MNQLSHPRVLLNVCTHGNERIGLRVAKYFQKTKIKKGIFVIHIANEKAMKKNKRFIDVDLNRVFPGKKKGNYEERLAYKLTPFIRSFDFVIDIHSTKTKTLSTIIITKRNKKTDSLLRAIAPRRVVHMKIAGPTALISHARCGIAFEYGNDRNSRTFSTTVAGVKRALAHAGLISENSRKPSRKKNLDFYEVYDSFLKEEGFVGLKRIKNFHLLKKGETVGLHKKNKKVIVAPHSFYPVLFGNNSYTSIFGFMAQKKIL